MTPDNCNPGTISSFSGLYHFLSNFCLCRVVHDDIEYASVEHAYQAAKAVDPVDRDRIRLASTPTAAKRLGRHVLMRPDFELHKLDVMRECLRSKFARPGLRGKLLDTLNMTLVEGNSWGDCYWGVCNGRGENWLGKLLMEVRHECRS